MQSDNLRQEIAYSPTSRCDVVVSSPLLHLHGEEGTHFVLRHVPMCEDLVAVLIVVLVPHSVEDIYDVTSWGGMNM